MKLNIYRNTVYVLDIYLVTIGEKEEQNNDDELFTDLMITAMPGSFPVIALAM